jgi:hypothetical protein
MSTRKIADIHQMATTITSGSHIDIMLSSEREACKRCTKNVHYILEDVYGAWKVFICLYRLLSRCQEPRVPFGCTNISSLMQSGGYRVAHIEAEVVVNSKFKFIGLSSTSFKFALGFDKLSQAPRGKSI